MSVVRAVMYKPWLSKIYRKKTIKSWNILQPNQNMEIQTIFEPIFIIVQETVNEIGSHCWRNPFPSMDSSFYENIGCTRTSFTNLDYTHIPFFIRLPNRYSAYIAELCGKAFNIFIQLEWINSRLKNGFISFLKLIYP